MARTTSNARSTFFSSSDESFSNFGSAEKLKNILSEWSSYEYIPGLKKQREYDFYLTNTLYGLCHDIVVVGCSDADKTNFRFFTIELQVTKDRKTHYITTNLVDTKDEQWKHITTIKNVTIDNFINFALELAKHHGSYHSFFNNCQHFARTFLARISEKKWDDYSYALQRASGFQNCSSCEPVAAVVGCIGGYAHGNKYRDVPGGRKRIFSEDEKSPLDPH